MSKKASRDLVTARALVKAGRLLRERREFLGISCDKAAQVSRLSVGMIRRIESGDQGVSLGILISYLNFLGFGSIFLDSLTNALKVTD